MNKSLNMWFRQIHRWIAVPTALLIPVALIIKLVGSQTVIDFWEKWDKIPSVLMLFMAITGAYLYFLPYIVKSRRNKPSQA
jgi:cytochrome bd-type quinol oxidase subunit 2